MAAKKDNTTTLVLLGVLAFLMFKQPSVPSGSGVDNLQFPPEPADKKSQEWTKWVQIVIAIAGGLIPALFGKGGPFAGKPEKTISAAAFWNVNLNANPGAALPGYNYSNPGWGQTSPYYGGGGGYIPGTWIIP